MPHLRSRTTTPGRDMAGARGLWRATGMKDENLGKPVTLVARRAAVLDRGDRVSQPLWCERAVSPALQAYAALITNAARGAVRDVGQRRT